MGFRQKLAYLGVICLLLFTFFVARSITQNETSQILFDRTQTIAITSIGNTEVEKLSRLLAGEIEKTPNLKVVPRTEITDWRAVDWHIYVIVAAEDIGYSISLTLTRGNRFEMSHLLTLHTAERLENHNAEISKALGILIYFLQQRTRVENTHILGNRTTIMAN